METNNNFDYLYDELSENFSPIDNSKEENIINIIEENFIKSIDESYFNENGFNNKFYDDLSKFINTNFDDKLLLEFILNESKDYSNSARYLNSTSIRNNLIVFSNSFLDYIDIESYFKNINFQESIKEDFLPIVYSKTDEWYYINCITSDLNYSFKVWPDLKIWIWKKTNFMWNDFKYFLEQEQVIEKMWWYHNMTNADIKAKIIPVEKIKKLNIEWLNYYILELEKDIEANQEEYKKRVKEIWERWIDDL